MAWCGAKDTHGGTGLASESCTRESKGTMGGKPEGATNYLRPDVRKGWELRVSLGGVP